MARKCVIYLNLFPPVPLKATPHFTPFFIYCFRHSWRRVLDYRYNRRFFGRYSADFRVQRTGRPTLHKRSHRFSRPFLGRYRMFQHLKDGKRQRSSRLHTNRVGCLLYNNRSEPRIANFIQTRLCQRYGVHR